MAIERNLAYAVGVDASHAPNRIFTLSVIGMRSPLASVSSLLSSSTELRSSIQMASTGPSHVTHVV